MSETASEARGRGDLGRELVANMEWITLDRIGGHGLDNAKRNVQFRDRGKSLKALAGETIGEGDHAIVLGAGPSLHRFPIAEEIKAASYRGAIVVTDSCMSYCLRNGIVPDLVVTLDPHAKRIVRWFGDPKLLPEHLVEDDYHSRQDMDPVFTDEIRANLQMIDLLNEHGSKMKIALATSASDAVVDRVLETGMQVYWWNPMYDDPSKPGSVTKELQKLNGFPSVNAGGNVGTACWVLADAVLGKSRVALGGIDFGYYAETPYKNTQYYRDALDLVGEENLDSLFMPVFNPHLQRWFYTDPAYMWYRECFLEMAADADCVTYNCTQGGILFGDGIRFVPLETFLQETAG